MILFLSKITYFDTKKTLNFVFKEVFSKLHSLKMSIRRYFTCRQSCIYPDEIGVFAVCWRIVHKWRILPGFYASIMTIRCRFSHTLRPGLLCFSQNSVYLNCYLILTSFSSFPFSRQSAWDQNIFILSAV